MHSLALALLTFLQITFYEYIIMPNIMRYQWCNQVGKYPRGFNQCKQFDQFEFSFNEYFMINY